MVIEAKQTAKQEIVTVDKRKVKCNGNGGALGHPLVYLQIDKSDSVVCPYCSKKFVYEENKSNN